MSVFFARRCIAYDMKKKKRLRFVAVLPSAITLLNGFFGFSAILIASHDPGLIFNFPLLPRGNLSYPAISAWLILLSMIADALDGTVARASGYTSGFGAQLDSLCDAVSFGAAPALLAYKMFAIELEHLRGNEVRFANLIGRWVLFAAIFYAMCALVRLARFNVETDEGESSHMVFSGLPSPAAAGLIVSLVLFHEEFASNFIIRLSFTESAVPRVIERVSLWVLPFALMAAGALMVSRIPYPHFVNRVLRSRKPFTLLPLTIFLVLFVMWTLHISLLLIFLIFCLYGIVRWLSRRRSKRRTSPGSGPDDWDDPFDMDDMDDTDDLGDLGGIGGMGGMGGMSGMGGMGGTNDPGGMGGTNDPGGMDGPDDEDDEDDDDEDGEGNHIRK